MAAHDPYDDLADADEKYHESSDEDFNPTAAAPSDESSSSASEAEAAPVKPSQRRRKRKAPASDDLDSGDEVTIEAAKKRKVKRRKGGKGGDEDDLLLSDDEGGEGGLIKTRAQRRVEPKEQRPLAGIEGATIDVDAIWAQMSAAPLRPVQLQLKALEQEESQLPAIGIDGIQRPAQVEDEIDLVSVRKTYTFAGQATTEEKQVPRSTLEKYLKDGWVSVDGAAEPVVDKKSEQDGVEQGAKTPRVHRPLRRPSRFDPNPTGYVRALPPEHQLTWPRKPTTATTGDQENIPVPEAPKPVRPGKAQKLNVVDKSRLDWTGFVDKEGIAEELDVHGKTKEAYLGRMEFLAGVEARREEERRRLKAAAASS